MEKKTFWSVKYYNGGRGNGCSEAWFDDKEKAYEFANHDYRNNPVRHTVSNLDKIKEYEELVMITNYEFNH